MPASIEVPTIVEHAVERLGAVFANAPERRHVGEDLTGLVGAETKNVAGLNAEVAQTTDQSCRNRWLTEVDWDVVKLKAQRGAWLPQDPQTRAAPSGGIPIDNTLGEHAGQLIEDVGYYGEHAAQRYTIVHAYLIANDGCPLGKHYAK